MKKRSKRSSHSGVPWCAKISRSKLVSLLFCGCKPCNSGENGGYIKGEESVKERRSNADAEVSKEEMSSLENARDRAVGWLGTLLASAGQLIKQFSGYHLRLLSSRHKKSVTAQLMDS